MKKNGFTLLELLAVVVIVAVVGVSASLAFNNIEDETADEELTNKYVEIQRAANLYLDLHSADLEWFIENEVIFYKLADLKNENYITSDLDNPVTGGLISSNYYVKIYIKREPTSYNAYEVSSCIIDRKPSQDVCIADYMGNYKETARCCE